MQWNGLAQDQSIALLARCPSIHLQAAFLVLPIHLDIFWTILRPATTVQRRKYCWVLPSPVRLWCNRWSSNGALMGASVEANPNVLMTSPISIRWSGLILFTGKQAGEFLAHYPH
ncbi:MAG: hypothetical protein V4454_14030 [Pseudomonadota bacterium]